MGKAPTDQALPLGPKLPRLVTRTQWRFLRAVDSALSGFSSLSGEAGSTALRKRHTVREAEAVLARLFFKSLNLPKGLIESVCELLGVIFVEDQGRADFQHVAAGALDSHEDP